MILLSVSPIYHLNKIVCKGFPLGITRCSKISPKRKTTTSSYLLVNFLKQPQSERFSWEKKKPTMPLLFIFDDAKKMFYCVMPEENKQWKLEKRGGENVYQKYASLAWLSLTTTVLLYPANVNGDRRNYSPKKLGHPNGEGWTSSFEVYIKKNPLITILNYPY